MGKMQSATWAWHFDQPPEAIWPALADTARFNEAAELPRHKIEETPQDDGTVLYTGRAKVGPFSLAWREVPVEWVQPQRFRHARLFHNGPLKSLIATLTLTRDGGGCRADYLLEAEPANLLGSAILAAGFFKSAGKTFHRLVSRTRDFVAGKSDQPFPFKPAQLGNDAKAASGGDGAGHGDARCCARPRAAPRRLHRRGAGARSGAYPAIAPGEAVEDRRARCDRAVPGRRQIRDCWR